LLQHPVDAGVVARATSLKVVSTISAGVDHIDLAACEDRGILVTNTPDVLTEATADFAFGLLLATARRICEGDRLVRLGGFRGWKPGLLVGTAVHGKTLGIVGLGRIGRAVARRARGFGIRVYYAQRTRLSEAMERALGARYVPVDGLFVESDFVSLHCPLTEETRGIASRARLLSMKPGSLLVNTSRGLCVDEAALVEVLGRGPLAGAGLDVYAHEPEVPASLVAMQNVVLGPHIASAEKETREAMAMMAVDNIVAAMQGREPPSRVCRSGTSDP